MRSWWRRASLALLSFSVPPNVQLPHDEPLPPGETSITGAPAATWTKKRAVVPASRVRLNGLGARTHANWVLFRLPFSAMQGDRVRAVRFTPHVASRSDVGALLVGSLCFDFPSRGGIDAWSLYTVSGIGHTERFGWHIAPPTNDPTILGINVPTRVANYVACGLDEGHLRRPDDWSLSIEWEER
jgi:hypothetical protein